MTDPREIAAQWARNDRAAAARVSRVRLFRIWMWVIIPALGVVLYCALAAGYHPVRAAPRPFSCAAVAASLQQLGAGWQIAPLCGQAPYPDRPASSDADG